jgi:hypothetical protein
VDDQIFRVRAGAMVVHDIAQQPVGRHGQRFDAEVSGVQPGQVQQVVDEPLQVQHGPVDHRRVPPGQVVRRRVVQQHLALANRCRSASTSDTSETGAPMRRAASPVNRSSDGKRPASSRPVGRRTPSRSASHSRACCITAQIGRFGHYLRRLLRLFAHWRTSASDLSIFGDICAKGPPRPESRRPLLQPVALFGQPTLIGT